MDSFQSNLRGIRHRLFFAGFCVPAFLFCFSGCAVWSPLTGEKPPRTNASTEPLTAYYEYPPAAFSGTVIETEEKRSYVRRQVELPLSLPPALAYENLEELKKEVSEIEKNDRKKAGDLKLRFTNRIDFYVPRNIRSGEKRPLILISPILGGNMVVDRFAAYYAGRGYIAAIVHRKKPYLSDKPSDLSGIEDYMRTSVIRLRQAIDWASLQPEVDPERIGAFGISYGAILHAVLAAVEPRVKYHILAMPAGGIAEIIMKVPEKPIRKLVRQAKEDFGWPEERIYSELKQHLQTDPLYFAPYVDRNRVEVYVALFDRVVGAGNTWELWRELGKPSLKILPFGHYGGVLVFPFLQTQSYLSFKKHLNAKLAE